MTTGNLNALLRGFAAASCFVASAGPLTVAHAGETRGYVVNWFYMTPAVQDAEKDCPGGLNPPADQIFARILKELGTPPADIEKALADFPFSSGGNTAMRGRINGQPVNVYANPTSTPDPNIKTIQGKLASGLNVDGKIDSNDFTDPANGEAGVDNQLFRALGCIISERAEPNTRPTYPSVQWDTARPQMQAWLIEISGIDDPQNDPEVEVGLYQATAPIVRDMTTDVQADMTYTLNNNPRSINKVRGSLKNGTITTDTFNLNMVGHRYFLPELTLQNAKLRLALNSDGTLKGVVGGFQKWAPLYANLAKGGNSYEVNLSFDIPGIYYALKKMADANPDPATGQNLAISAGYTIEAVPAFIIHSERQTAESR
jgi:hypothetical protein